MVYPVKHDISDGDYMVLTEAVWRKFANLYGYDYCIKRRAVHQACSSEDSPAWEQGKHWLEYKDAHDPRDFSSSAESPRPLNAPDEDGTTTNVASTSPIGPQAQQDQGNGTCTSSSAMTIALAPNPYHGAAKLELEGAAIPVFHAVKGKTEECPGGDPQVILYESAHASADAVLRRLAAYFEVADPMAVVTSTSDKVVEVATATTFGTEVEQTQPQQTGVPTSCALPLPDESEQQLQAVASPFEERPPVPHAHQLPQPHQGESSSSTSSVLKAPTSSCKAGNDQHRSHPYKQKQNILPTTPLDSWRRRKLQFWDYFQNKKFGQAPINLSEHKSLKGHRIGPRNPILLEEADEGGEFFPKATVSSSSSSSMFSGFGRMNQHQEDVPERTDNKSNAVGSVGLNNLGNTCYMNSSLQCINSLPWLKEFFVSRQYKEFLNDQAWKSQGKIADSFSNLMKLMWEKDVIKVAPRRFKQELGQFAEQFSGYMQHDAMEFLESLIDALKEDTNTVKGRKPYFQFPDDDVRPEREILEAYLQGHRRRDNSFIDESCFQLERSRVRCPKCAKVSVTFSHNLAASLQMVSAREQKFVNMTVNVVRKNKAFWNPPMEVMTGAGGTGSSLTSSSSTCLFGGAASATTAASSSTTSNTNMMNNMNQHQVDVVQLAPCSTPFPNPAEQERSGVVAAPPASASATSSSGGETQSAFTYLTSPTSASTRSRRSEVLTSDVVLTSSSTSTSTTCPASCSSSSSSNKVGTNRPLPTQISVDVPKGSSVADLIQQIATSHSQHCGHWDLEKNILVVDVRNPRAFKYYEPRDNVDLIQKHEVLYIYEVDDRSCFSEDREVLELANGAGGQSSGPIIALPPPTGDAVVAPAVDTTSAAGASTSSSSSSSSSTTAATSTAVVSPEQGQSPEHGGDDQDKTSAAAGETPTCATSNSSPSANVSTSGDTIAGDGTSCANSQSPSPAPEVGASACGSGSGLTTTSKDAPRQGAAPSSSTSSAAATLFGTCSSSTSLEASAKNSSCQEVDCPSAQELEFHTARSETELNSISCTSSGVGGGAQPMELVGVGLEQTTAPRPVVPDEVEQEHKDSAAPTSTTSLDNNKPFTSTTSRTTSSSTFPNISSSTTSSSMPRVASSGSMPVVAGSSSSSSSLPPISLSEVPVPMEGVQLTTTTTLKRPHVDASSPSDRDDVVPPCTWLNNNNYTASSGGSAGCFPGGSNSTMSTTTGSASSTSSNGCSTSSSCASTILHNGIVMHINNNANSMGGRNFHTFQKIPPVVFSVPRNTTVGEFYKVSREKLALHIGVPQTSQLPALHIFKKEANKSNSTWGRAFTSESEVQEFLEDGSPNTALVFEDDQVPGKKYFRIAEQNVEATQLTQFDFPSPRPIGSEKRRKSELFLESLLESYMEEEQLGEDDLWRCPRCDERLPAYKKLDLYKLPPVFVIHLKRFQYTRWSRERISTPVKYPAVLNMESMVVDKSNSVPSSNCEDKADTDTNTYYLSGVVRHEGTPDGGHYIAFARNCVTGEWYEFNDSIVTPKTEEQVLSETVSAYVLFYTRGNYATWRKMKGCSNGRSGATTSACTSSSATATFTSRSSTAAPVGDTASCSTVTAHIANIDDQGSSTSQEMISSGRTSLQKSVAQMLETVRRNAEASDGDSTAASSNAERI
ncbi:unnamed protein product [Amoebophrya sp. A25]|nr:unnamed protein product [Amoebophrya sp. A25]|eukprot:GSA25T00009336001.1